MIFLTVGTQFPFDRLVKAVDDIVAKGSLGEEIFAQIGKSSYRPRNFKAVSFIEGHLFDKYIREASSVIGHAGMGTIAAVLERAKPMLVIPRQQQYGEVVNNHQVTIAKKFEGLGYILVAYEQSELENKLEVLKSFTPNPRKIQLKPLTDRISNFLKMLSENRKKF
jgi:beta-1,4-N-acetylglucosaminyltransferase